MTHEDIIVKLGDTAAVQEAVNVELAASGAEPLTLSSVSVWKARGIPWRFRPTIARLARSRNVLLPADFLLAA